MQKVVISQNNSETLEIATDEARFAIKQMFEDTHNYPLYKVILLNRKEADKLKDELARWLSG